MSRSLYRTKLIAILPLTAVSALHPKDSTYAFIAMMLKHWSSTIRILANSP